MFQRMRIASASLVGITIVAGCHRSQPAQIPIADQILITKSAHSLMLLRNHQLLQTYKVALGKGGAARKSREGDHLTPEGEYIVDSRKPNSRFHKALHLSYPNEIDRKQAELAHLPPGGDIEIHGVQNGLGWIGPIEHWIDWTDGCIALSDSQMDEVWNAAPLGTRVEIRQ
jgi:murein L,D-transpeptidase YafK